jgi:hypothetical protein
MDNYLKHLCSILPGEYTNEVIGNKNILKFKFIDIVDESKRMGKLGEYYKVINEIVDYIKTKSNLSFNINGHDVDIVY